MKFRTHGATAGFSVVLLATALSAQTSSTVSAGTSVSKVRIVRLSEIRGAVDLDRSNGRGLEPAIANLPIVESNRLQTAVGVAEVEFEDNSSLRVAPNSIVEFPELSRTAAGTTVSSVHLIKGMAYLTLVKSKGNAFNLIFGEHTVAVPPGAHLRLFVNQEGARLAVLDGPPIMVDTPHGQMAVEKKRTASLLMTSDIDASVAKTVDADPFDAWDKQATEYHARLAAFSAFGNSPYSYGLSDMMYYGSFANSGCGSMWRPYFTSASWEPYSAGSWAYYQGAGYTYVSPYPWGWTPFHTGSWNYCPGAGWGWQPGGMWNGLNNGSMIAFNPTNTPGGMGRFPVAPPHPPRAGEPTTVAILSKPVVRSEMTGSNSFVFRKDSAGFGVPRGELGGLSKFSQNAIAKGTASTNVYLSNSSDGVGGGARGTGGQLGAVSLHRGSPPPAANSQLAPYSAGGGGYSGGGGGTRGPSSSSSSSSSSTARPSPAPSGGGRSPR